jgi:hypothetical protein
LQSRNSSRKTTAEATQTSAKGALKDA